MFRRIAALVKKEFIHLMHDWWLPAFMIFGGVLELLLVGWATSRPITNLPIMVLDHDRSAHSRLFIQELVNTGTFQIPQMVEDRLEIQTAMTRGDINAAVIIPPGFDTEMNSPDGQPLIFFILNGAESTPALASKRAIQGLALEINERLVLKNLGANTIEVSGFFPSLQVWFNENLSEALYTTPAELGLMLEFTTLLFAALAFSREKELGTLEQLLVMPFSAMEIIIGKAIPVIVIAFTDFLLMLGMVHFAFDVPIRGSLLLLFSLALVYLLVELGKGMVISVISRTQHQAFLFVLLVGMVDFMFTGYAAPVDGMPVALQWFANIIPAHHWLEILRGILLKGTGLEVLWPHILALLALGLVIGIFSLRFVRRSLD
ncbi:ABC transporter permease [Chloroflexota bacterium]